MHHACLDVPLRTSDTEFYSAKGVILTPHCESEFLIMLQRPSNMACATLPPRSDDE